MTMKLSVSRGIERGRLQKLLRQGFEEGTLKSVSEAYEKALSRMIRRTEIGTLVMYTIIATATPKINFSKRLLEEALEASRRFGGDQNGQGTKVLTLRYLRTIINTATEFFKGNKTENDNIMRRAIGIAGRVFHEGNVPLSEISDALKSTIRKALQKPEAAGERIFTIAPNKTSQAKKPTELLRSIKVDIAHEGGKIRNHENDAEELHEITLKTLEEHDINHLWLLVHNKNLGSNTVTLILESELPVYIRKYAAKHDNALDESLKKIVEDPKENTEVWDNALSTLEGRGYKFDGFRVQRVSKVLT